MVRMQSLFISILLALGPLSCASPHSFQSPYKTKKMKEKKEKKEKKGSAQQHTKNRKNTQTKEEKIPSEDSLSSNTIVTKFQANNTLPIDYSTPIHLSKHDPANKLACAKTPCPNAIAYLKVSNSEMCSSFAINNKEDETVLVTNAHCLKKNKKKGNSCQEIEAIFLSQRNNRVENIRIPCDKVLLTTRHILETIDIAILSLDYWPSDIIPLVYGSKLKQPLSLWGIYKESYTETYHAGFPFYSQHAFVEGPYWNTIANFFLPKSQWKNSPVFALETLGVPGTSGSAIINRKGQAVAVNQGASYMQDGSGMQLASNLSCICMFRDTSECINQEILPSCIIKESIEELSNAYITKKFEEFDASFRKHWDEFPNHARINQKMANSFFRFKFSNLPVHDMHNVVHSFFPHCYHREREYREFVLEPLPIGYFEYSTSSIAKKVADFKILDGQILVRKLQEEYEIQIEAEDNIWTWTKSLTPCH